MKKQVVIILANGHEEVEAITVIDLLRRAGINVIIAGLGGKEIAGAHDIRILTDITVDQTPTQFEGVILPGGFPGTSNLAESDIVKSIVQDSYHKGLLTGAICAAPLVLEIAGVLAGKKYTCYPGNEKKIKSGQFIEESVVQDGNIITSRGVGTAIPFALKIIEYLLGDVQSQSIASSLLFSFGKR
ncbi:MAG: DJ-1/PfpI family protein [Chitinispirillia bacterium]|jgi:4-methyl-5(b-hydroxyethyl)-thiazole monophosphate biosynthesis